MRHRILLSSLFALTGCAFVPSTGTWTASGSDVTDTTCETRDQRPVRDGATLTIETIEKGSFRLRIVGEPAFGCSTQGKSFTCGIHRDDVDAAEDGDAELHLSTTLDGTFLGESSLTAYRYVDVVCEGESCEDVADNQGRVFPCATTSRFNAVLTDPTIPRPDGDDTEDSDPVD